MVKLMAVGCVALLAGCASVAPRIETVQIKVPVAVPCPVPRLPAKPTLPLGMLIPTSTPSQVVKAYATTVTILMGYSKSLLTILSSYKQNKDPNN